MAMRHKKIINDSFDIVSQKSDMIPDDTDLIENHNKYDENIPNDQFYDDLINRIKELSKNKKLSNDKRNIEKILQGILSNDRTYYDFLFNNYNMFQSIVSTENEKIFFELNNAGIGIFQDYINDRFFRMSKIGKVAYGEKKALEVIINHIEQNLGAHSQKQKNLRIVRLKHLMEDMRKTVVHLENTH